MLLPYQLFLIFLLVNFGNSDIKCDIESNECDKQDRRYLIYGINFGEGFNLRRDVYLRISNVVRQLREKGQNVILILPPWFTPHWRQNIHQARQWSEFFDLSSLNRFVPVMEFDDFLKENDKKVDSLLYLQHYSEGWDGGEYVIKYDLRPCMEADKYFDQLEDGSCRSIARSLREANFKQLRCLSIQGESETLVKAILELEPKTKSLFVDRVETILHDNFGDKFYWQARRSMRYAENLRAIGDKFRQDIFGSTDQSDKTIMNPNWQEHQPKVGSAIGGNYLCVHWRRRDFVYAHKKEVPSIQGTVDQVSNLLRTLKLNKVFVSTDAEIEEYRELNEELSELGFQVSRFSNNTLSEGAISIVDQWICSHSRYFIGTHVSTFSYRIHEDREILGFYPKMTFNRLCPEEEINCEQPAKWTIVYK